MDAEVEFVEALRPVVAANDLEIWDVERSGNSVRVLVDRPGGVDLDSLAALSRAVSDFLDEHDELVPMGRYELDVSSPGVERRLRYPEHFVRCLGQEVAIKTASAVDGMRRFQGILMDATAEEVHVAGKADDGVEMDVRLPLEAIERAHTVFRWGPPAKSPKVGARQAHVPKTSSRSKVKVIAATAPASEEGR